MNLKSSIYSTTSFLANPFKGVLLDVYGVFWGGNGVGLLEGTKESMRKLVKDGKIVGILSNTTVLVDNEIKKFEKHGLIEGQHFHFVLTAGEIAKLMLLQEILPFPTPRKKFWLFGTSHPKYPSHEPIFKESQFKETANIDEADFIYPSIPHINGEDQIDCTIFRKEIRKLNTTHLPMVCANPDHFAHEGDPPRPVVRQGRIASIYEELGGRVVYIGKPHQKAFEKAMQYFAHYNIKNPSEVLMIGDTPETDIRGAKKFGMSTALVLQTGMFNEKIINQGFENALRTLSAEDYPQFLIERFIYDKL